MQQFNQLLAIILVIPEPATLGLLLMRGLALLSRRRRIIKFLDYRA